MVFKSARKLMTGVAASLSIVLAASGLGVATAASASAAERLHEPMKSKSYEISSRYGPRCIPVANASTWHYGDDFEAKKNKPIYAIDSGVVTQTRHGSNSTAGAISIRHTIDGKTYYSRYLHVWDADKYVKVGQKVKAGKKIGLVGSSGASTSNHLHFEIRKGSTYGTPVNPIYFMKKHGVNIKKMSKRVWNIKRPSTCTYYTTGGVNVRSGPSTRYKIVKRVSKGTSMKHKPGKMTNSYIPVTISGRSGWVHSGYITKDKPKPSVKVTNIKNRRMYVKKDNVKINKYARESSSNVKNLKRTWSVIVTHKTSNGMYKVKRGNKVGYVSKKYLLSNKPSANTKTLVDVKDKTFYAKKKTTLYRYDRTTSQALRSISRSGSVKVTHKVKNSSLYRVSKGGKIGYVKSSDFTRKKSATRSTKAQYKTTTRLNFRTGPSTSNKVVRTLKKGQSVGYIKKTKGSWKKITVSGKTGWVSGRYLTKK